MPPRGYAPGMISSYARFLGLTLTVVDAYFDELHTYERVNNTGTGRFQDSVAEAGVLLTWHVRRPIPHGQRSRAQFSVRSKASPRQIRFRVRFSPHEPMPANSLQYGRPGRGERQRALPRGGDYRASGQARYGQGARSMRDVRYPSREDRPGNASTADRPLRGQASSRVRCRTAMAIAPIRACRSSGGNSISAVSRQISSAFLAVSDNRVLLMLGAAAIIILLLLLLFFRGCASFI